MAVREAIAKVAYGIRRCRRTVQAALIGYLAALAAVGLVSLAIGAFVARAGVDNISMLYLIAVLATATAFGSGPAILAAAAAVLTFEWFFVEPMNNIAITTAEQWMELILFLLTAIITGELAAGLRRRAWQSKQREREAKVLYDVVRLLSEPELDRAIKAVAALLRQEHQLSALAIELIDDNGHATESIEVGDPEALACLHAAAAAPSHVYAEGPGPTEDKRGATGRWIRVVPPHSCVPHKGKVHGHLQVVPIKVQGRRLGTILMIRDVNGVAFREADDRLISAAATQFGVAAERARLRKESTEGEILRRTDELKTALLNTVSHELRTPLASVVASAGSLLQEDVEWSEQERRDFASAIEREARRLDQLVGNLLDLSRIQAGSLQPEKGWYDLGALIDDVLGRLRSVTGRH